MPVDKIHTTVGPHGRGGRIGVFVIAAAMSILPATLGAPALANDALRKEIACSICDGLANAMSGMPEQPFFIRSFEPANGGSELHPALSNTAFTYDNALALMALYGCHRAEEARRIADALVLAVQADRHYHDGRLRNAYRSGPVEVGKDGILLPGYWSTASNSWIEDGYQVGSATGSTAWGALALLTAYEETKRPAYLEAAEKVMDWIHQSTLDKSGKGYFGGFYGYEPTPQRLTWKSTEHNLDVYAADTWLAKLDGKSDWAHYATASEDFLKGMWDDGEGRFYIGTLPDSAKPNAGMSGLDAELWPLIAVPSLKDKASRVLAWTEANHGVPGGFDFNNDRDGTWLEGTAQAALTYSLTGHPEKADPLFRTIKQQIAPDGLVFATVQDQITTGLQVGPNSTPGDFKYYRLPHIGASGWAVLAALDINPFVGRDGGKSESETDPCHPK